MPEKPASKDFDDFIKKQREIRVEQNVPDWNKERTEWLDYLDKLYVQIEKFLAEYTRTEDIAITYQKVPLEEENIGKYDAPAMTLKLGNQTITLTPIGTLLIGMKGRVEAAGPRGQFVFVLVDQKSSGPQIKVTMSWAGQAPVNEAPEPPREIVWTWKLLAYTPRLTYIDLTQEVLFKALMAIANA